MSSDRSSQPTNTRLLASGAVLAGVGGALATVGVALGSAAVLGAGRRWQQGTEMTPTQLAKHALGAAQIATSAGYGAWRGPTTPPAATRRISTDGVGVPVS